MHYLKLGLVVMGLRSLLPCVLASEDISQQNTLNDDTNSSFAHLFHDPIIQILRYLPHPHQASTVCRQWRKAFNAGHLGTLYVPRDRDPQELLNLYFKQDALRRGFKGVLPAGNFAPGSLAIAPQGDDASIAHDRILRFLVNYPSIKYLNLLNPSLAAMGLSIEQGCILSLSQSHLPPNAYRRLLKLQQLYQTDKDDFILYHATALQSLSLDIGRGHLPDKALSRLRFLTSLDLHFSGNYESCVIPRLTFPQLRRLSIMRHGGLQDLEAIGLPNLTVLEELRLLRCSRIKENAFSSLTRLTKLNTLILSEVGKQSEGLLHLMSHVRLRALALNEQALTSELLQCLARQTSLTKLNLGGSFSAGGKKYYDAIGELSKLTTLRVFTFPALVLDSHHSHQVNMNDLIKDMTSLEALDLKSVTIMNTSTQMQENLRDSLSQFPHLRFLRLSPSVAVDTSFLQDIFIQHPQLRVLSFKTYIDEVQHCLVLLRQLTSLETLEIKGIRQLTDEEKVQLPCRRFYNPKPEEWRQIQEEWL